MIKHLGLFLGALGCFWFVSAQSVTPFVYASAGDYFENSAAGASLSFTVGEMSMVETFFANQHFLTQGFQQPEVTAINVADAAEIMEEFVIFPNPASDHLNIRYQLRYPGELSLQMINLNGVAVLPVQETRYTGGLREDQLQLEGLAQGMYMLRVVYESPKRGAEHVSYHKINVIKY